MNFQTLTCPICTIQYDQKSHIPKIITACGHTICLHCLKKILENSNEPKCPLDNVLFLEDRKTLDSFPVNFTVTQLNRRDEHRRAM